MNGENFVESYISLTPEDFFNHSPLRGEIRGVVVSYDVTTNAPWVQAGLPHCSEYSHKRLHRDRQADEKSIIHKTKTKYYFD